MKYAIKNASVTIGGKDILTDINFEIKDNDHIGIVGKNGAGKTTLLNALIDNELLDEGIEEVPFEVIKIGEFKIGYLNQITFKDKESTLLEEVRKSFKEFIDLEHKMEKLLSKMDSEDSVDCGIEYAEVLDRYKFLGGYSYQKEYEEMIRKFGFSDSDKNRPLSSFSGGERTKIALMKLLLSKPDILFLDEPTNHLDIEAIVWLEDYLKNYKGAFVVVSHDRMFLNNIVNIIYDVTHGKVIRYVGNYDYYEKKKKEDYDRQLYDYESQQKEIRRLNELYERFRGKPTKARMALSRLKMIERMEIVEKPIKESERSFKNILKQIAPSGRSVASLKNLVVGYDTPLATCNFEIAKGDRIGVIGANGTGKSTLLKTIYNLVEPISGHVSFGYNVKVGYFDQNLEVIDPENTILEEFKKHYPEVLDKDARSALGAFLFSGEDVSKTVGVLSGGEKVRLQLCIVLFDKPNFLVLDEPTNHMDLLGKEQLERILEEYSGSIIFVSHDRYFVRKLATSMLVFDGTDAKLYHLGYDDCMNLIRETESAKVQPTKPKTGDNKKIQGRPLNLERELKSVEKEIEKYEMKIKELNEKLFDPDVYNDREKAKSVENEKEAIQSILDEKNERWNELVDALGNDI